MLPRRWRPLSAVLVGQNAQGASCCCFSFDRIVSAVIVTEDVDAELKIMPRSEVRSLREFGGLLVVSTESTEEQACAPQCN